MTLESPYFVEVSEGIKEKCQELGWECTVQDPKMDVASQLAAIETYIDQKYGDRHNKRPFPSGT